MRTARLHLPKLGIRQSHNSMTTVSAGSGGVLAASFSSLRSGKVFYCEQVRLNLFYGGTRAAKARPNRPAPASWVPEQ